MSPRRALAALAALLTVLCAARAQAQDEVPFITTPDNVTLSMLQLAGVSAQDRVVDLGSGDGRIVITAAQRFGASGLGVEIVPELVAQSRAKAELRMHGASLHLQRAAAPAAAQEGRRFRRARVRGCAAASPAPAP